ncbi:MAG: DUF362 domain-containing protein [Candidatus Humimicrobiaceae bacterium]
MVITEKFKGYRHSVESLLDNLSFGKKLNKINKIIIKPNLLEDAPHPCTTDKDCIDAILQYIFSKKSSAQVVILEGSGGCDTMVAYRKLGYTDLVSNYNIKLLDVDRCKYRKLENPKALAYKEIYLPEILFEGYFLISVPALKAHSITTVTLGMKNLIGLLPKKYYGQYWSYNRSDVHRVGVQDAIIDLNNYLKIGLTIVDGRIGQPDSHLRGGRRCSPEKNLIIGGYDVLEVDRGGAKILGYNWKNVKHLRDYEKSKCSKM